MVDVGVPDALGETDVLDVSVWLLVPDTLEVAVGVGVAAGVGDRVTLAVCV
jgi:hypothetical protein